MQHAPEGMLGMDIDNLTYLITGKYQFSIGDSHSGGNDMALVISVQGKGTYMPLTSYMILYDAINRGKRSVDDAALRKIYGKDYDTAMSFLECAGFLFWDGRYKVDMGRVASAIFLNYVNVDHKKQTNEALRNGARMNMAGVK
ncbi:MAG: hypothetical protein NT016_03325 [Candidatus Aenigmarchaeota archaeon]|nr:hypothetical protein [Candidatus Aenigmarchaeota archaeon]